MYIPVTYNDANMVVYDAVEAHCYVVDFGQTDREQIRSRINNKTDAGHFGHVGLYQLCTILYNCTTVLYAVDNGLNGQNVSSVASVVIDSATYLLTISSFDIGSVWPSSPLYWVIPSWASFAILEAVLQSSVHSRKQLPLWCAHLDLRVDIILHPAQNYPSNTCNAVEVLPAAFMFLVVTLSRDR